MAKVKQFSIDILVNGYEDSDYLEEKITKVLDDFGLYVCGVAYADDMTEYYKDWLED